MPPRAEWEPDAEATHCPCCTQAFGGLRRKHHCRACGRVVCGDCSKHERAVDGYTGDQRVCDTCYLAEPPAPGGAAQLLALLAPCCPCVETEDAKARRRRRSMLLAGARFSKRKFALGGLSIGLGGSEQITLKLRADGRALVWAPVGGGGGGGGGGGDEGDSSNLLASMVGLGGDEGEAEGGGGGGGGEKAWKSAATVDDLKGAEPKAAKTLLVLSRMGETLLEVEAADAATRDAWVAAVCELAGAKGGGDGGGGEPTVGRPSTMVERAKKQAHFAQRDVELTQQKKASEKRKEQYMKSIGGMKYTAMAMANRAS